SDTHCGRPESEWFNGCKPSGLFMITPAINKTKNGRTVKFCRYAGMFMKMIYIGNIFNLCFFLSFFGKH
ncbi:TPA: hypothetical protein ACYUZM_005590, partial [Escherichia coli]